MQQRRLAAGRPSGTDGSYFSYRMLVDPRYRKVAQGKSRLRALIIMQAGSLVAGAVGIALSAFQVQAFSLVPTVSILITTFSLIIGDLGSKRSSKNLLNKYKVALSVASVLSIACSVTSDLSYEVLSCKSLQSLLHFSLWKICLRKDFLERLVNYVAVFSKAGSNHLIKGSRGQLKLSYLRLFV